MGCQWVNSRLLSVTNLYICYLLFILSTFNLVIVNYIILPYYSKYSKLNASMNNKLLRSYLQYVGRVRSYLCCHANQTYAKLPETLASTSLFFSFHTLHNKSPKVSFICKQNMSFRPPKTLPILSIFHNGNLARSRAALDLLQKRATQKNGNDAYRIDVIDTQPPTVEQLRQVASFLPTSPQGNSETHWHQMVQKPDQLHDWSEIAQRLHEEPSLLTRPIVVDWTRGKAAIQPSDIENLINERVETKDQ
ncbi:hypothetical protein BDA99DRAFT_513318 [Phascolomyces articulosus]|uniref:Arsenate reductase n=1 Tax=Phascolomyces articulosus TaxID=60185 RepID=A0AAD5JXV2_9FUNG|nr:hypothetical protein BDA99DRAFT_513318 [Phascolomyces articulosus]